MNVHAQNEETSFWEEMATVFRWPALIALSLIAAAFVGCATWVTATLLDRVLTAFSAAAATKSTALGGLNLRDIVAALFWLFALGLIARRTLPAGSARTAVFPVLLVVLAGLLFAVPKLLAGVPLYVPIGILVVAWVAFVVLETRVVPIAHRELANLLLNPLGYVVLTVFSIVLAILFFGAVDQLANASLTSELNVAPLLALFGSGGNVADMRELNFLVIALLLIIPVITMRLLSEEKRSGTEEVLLTTPVREWHIVAGKFAGTFVFYLVLWAIAVIPILLLSQRGSLDWWQAGSSLLGLGIIGFGLLGIGLFASSVTRNQLAAAVLTFLGLLLFTFPSFTALPPAEGGFGILRSAGEYLDLRRHLAWIARGTIDSRTVFLFLSVGFFCLFLSVRALETRRWAGFGLWRAMGPFRGLVGLAGLIALIVGVFWFANLTGRQQVKTRKAAVRAEAQQVAAERAAAEARTKAAGAKPAATPLFEDDERKIGTSDATIKVGDEVAGEDDAKDPKETKPAPGAPGKKDPAKAGDEGADPPVKNVDEDETPEESATTETKPTGEGDASKSGSTKRKIAAVWTPARISKVVGGTLIGLIAFLVIFARLVSGGLRNQIVFGSNVIVASLAAATLALLVNYLATRNHKALDLTRDGLYSLPPAILTAVDGTLAEGETVDVIALVGRYPNTTNRLEVDDNIRRDTLERTFEKFAEALNRPGVRRFNFTFIDPKLESDRAKQIVSQFNTSGRHEIIVRYRDRYEILAKDALFEMRLHAGRLEAFLQTWANALQRGEYWPPMPPNRSEQIQMAELLVRERGSPDYLRSVRPVVDVEKRLAETIVQLVESPGNNLYYTVGHGEKKLDRRRGAADVKRNFGEASIFRRTLLRQNFDLTPLAPLTSADRTIPPRAKHVVIAGPKKPFTAQELDKLEKFVGGGGNLIVFTEAGDDTGLAPLLAKYGLTIENSQIWMGEMPRGRMTPRGPQLIPRMPYVILNKFEGDHPVLEALRAMQNQNTERSLRPFPSAVMVLGSPIGRIKDEKQMKEIEKRYKISKLLIASFERDRESMMLPYAESTLNTRQPRQDPGERVGPFDVGVIAEPTDPNQTGGKVVVISDTDFIEDRLQLPAEMGQPPSEVSTYGVQENDEVMTAILQYLKKRQARIDAEIQPPTTYSFSAGDQVSFVAWKNRAKWALWAFLPALFIISGLFVFYVRRRA